VRTHLLEITVAPQNTPISLLYKLHLQGNSFTMASLPPTILGASFRIPHVQEEELLTGAEVVVVGLAVVVVVVAGGGGAVAAVEMTLRVHWNLYG
jgi:hypothetical protein